MTLTVHTARVMRGEDVVSLRRFPLRIEIKRGADRKLRRDFAQDRVLIGSHESCDLVLADPTVSRQHCEIALVEGGYQVSDLDSTNGTFLGSARLGSVLLSEAADLRLGQTVIAISTLRSPVDIPLGSETRIGPLLGRSVAMRQVIATVEKIAPTEATVLITGESGTGKEVAARALHENSPRAAGPFVVVDCGALPASLIESELFGHERGSFTGAVGQRKGAFESAHGGTLFLDEIGEMPLESQTRLLGALERRTVQRIGSSEARSINVRVLAATNRDLRKEINRGRFREDLYFRLAVVTIELPPLRTRPEDIPLYVQQLARDLEIELAIDEPTMARLSAMSWPGNVRELRNFVERSAALGEVIVEGEPASAAPMPADDGAPTTLAVDARLPFKVGKAALIEDYERSYVRALIQLHEGNVSRAARAAQIDRMYMLRLLDKYGLRPSRQ